MPSPIRLELSDGSSHKFWEGAVDGSSLAVRFGRIGTDGQTQVKKFSDAKAAQAALDKLVAEKTKKGYSVLKGGAKAKLSFAAKGGNLPDIALGDLATPIVVRLVNSDTDVCFESRFDADGVRENSSEELKAK